MKRTVLILVVCLVSLSSFSQIEIDSANFAPHKDYYIMPASFGSQEHEGCAPFVPYTKWIVTDSTYCPYCEQMEAASFEFEYADNVEAGIYAQIAQPFYTDTILTIKGIAFQLQNHYRDCNGPEGFYLRRFCAVYDSNFNMVVWDTILNYDTEAASARYAPNYAEFFFENPITVMGTYYITYSGLRVLRISERCATNVPFGWYSSYDVEDYIPKGEDFIPLSEYQLGLPDFSRPSALDIYAFPIYQPTNSSLGDVNTIQTSLYPNPAKDVLNITSTQKIERVQLFNMMGQMIREEEVSSNTVQLDIKGLRQGSYIAKVLFNSGVTARKFVVE